MQLSLNAIYEALIVAYIIYMGQDYVRFRFNPPYTTKEECRDCKKLNSQLDQSREQNLQQFISRFEARMSRFEDLVLIALGVTKDKDGSD